MIEARQLHVALQGRPVLRGVDVTFGAGWTAVVGPNGAGKSTLLRALAGLLPQRSIVSGQVLLEQRSLRAWPMAERARALAWMAQQGESGGDLTVRDVVMLGRLPHIGLLGAPGPADEAAVDAALRATGARDWAHRGLQALSGGERQRVWLARALAVGSRVLLLDEPTAHLDPPHQMAVVRLMQRRTTAQTVVSVLHDLNLALRADRVLVLADGRVAASGTSDAPAVHRALESVFEGSIRISLDGADWICVPRLR